MMKIDFELYVCPNCGSIAVGKRQCFLCDFEMIASSQRADKIFLDNSTDAKQLENALKTLSKKYCPSFDRHKYKNFKRSLRKEASSIAKAISKNYILVCPKCGHISRTSFFYDNQQCCICKAPYMVTKKRCFSYYFFRASSPNEQVTYNQDELRKQFCKNTPLFRQDSWDSRMKIEAERLPTRLEPMAIVDDSGNPSIVLENIRMQQLIIMVFTYVNIYSLLLDKYSEVAQKSEYKLQFSDFISDAYCSVTMQYFAGQQVLSDFIRFFLIEISRQVSHML